ncbi:MAG: hypothetical protein ACI9GW_000761 [Halieaceae bacterium]|jgi:hypothetical protein
MARSTRNQIVSVTALLAAANIGGAVGVKYSRWRFAV